MKRLIKLFLLSMLLITMSCCQMTKPLASQTDDSEIIYKQTLKALDKQMFIIQACEFYFPTVKSPIKMSTGSYISLEGQHGVICFSPDVFPGDPWSYLMIEDNMAKLTKEKSKKNGDQQYSIKINKDKEWLKRTILITIYKNTNMCYVKVNDRTGTNIVDFKGDIYLKQN